MSNNNNFDFTNVSLKLSNNDYWDFYLAKDNNNPDCQPLTDGNCKVISFDFNNPLIYNADINSINSLTSWTGSTNTGYTFNTFGLTGLDNGRILFKKSDDLTNLVLSNTLMGSTLVIQANDNRLSLHKVSGYTNQFSYDTDIIKDKQIGDYLRLRGGFYQGFYKIDCDSYQILPNRVNNSWSIEFWLKRENLVTRGNILNNKYPNNKGFFFYIGTRAENKFRKEWQGNNTGCTSACTTDSACTESVTTWCTPLKEKDISIIADEHIAIPLIPPLVNIDLITNQFLIYGRATDTSEPKLTGNTDTIIINETKSANTENCLTSKDGLGTKTICDYDGKGIYVTKTAETITNTNNPFLIYGRAANITTNQCSHTTTGGTETICSFTGNTKPKTEIDYNSDIIDNALGFRIKDDGSIGYRLLTTKCDKGITKVIVEEKYSEPNMVPLDKWSYVVVKYITDNKTNEELKTVEPRKGKLNFYVNGNLIFVVNDFNEFIGKKLNEHQKKQIGVPFNISLGGGTQGLIESLTFDGLDPNDRELPIEKNFAGSFIGLISQFKFNICNLTLCNIRSIYKNEASRYYLINKNTVTDNNNMKTNLTLGKLTSPFLPPFNDITKGNILTQEEFDEDFIYLKGEIIYSAQTTGNIIKLNKLNAQDISIEIPESKNMITGGTYNKTTGIATFTNISGGTFDVKGFFNSTDDIYISGVTVDKTTGTVTFTNSRGCNVEININGTVCKDNTNLSDEIKRATNVENNIQINIDNEIKRATNVENTLQTNIDNEIRRATNIENTTQINIDNEIKRATNVENTILTNIDNEIKRATNFINVVIDTVKLEKDKFINTQTALNTVIGNEIKRATDAEVALGNIKADKTAVDTIKTDLQNQVDVVKQKLTSDDTNFDTLQKVVTEIKKTKTITDDTNFLHKTGDEIKTGKLTVNNIITKGGTADQYVKGDGSLATLTLPTPIDISGKEDIVKKGIANGYTPLDELKKVASEYLNIVDNLTSGGTTSLLSAEQGKVLKSQIDGINTILNSNDVNLDTVQELVDAIKTIQTSLSTILVNDLTTGGTTKALTAEQGKVLKEIIDSYVTKVNDGLAKLELLKPVIQTRIDTEIKKITDAEQLLATAIADESKRAIAAETDLQNKLKSDDTNFDTLQKVVTELKKPKTNIDETNILHTTGDEIKTGKLTVDNIITKGGTADQYVKGDGSLATLTLPTPIDITGKEDISKKGIAGGYVPLDDLKKIASEYLNIVDNLTSGGTTSLLSAEQGKTLKSQIDGIKVILASDDINLDTVQELVGAIKELQTSFSTILVNDLTTGGTTKALTAEQGKVLKDLYDAGKIKAENLATTLGTAIADETKRAGDAEIALGNTKADKTTVDTIKTDLQSKIDTEVNRATDSEIVLQQNIINETNRATSAETALQISKEDISNKVTNFKDNVLTDSNYPTSKAVYNFSLLLNSKLNDKIDNERTLNTADFKKLEKDKEDKANKGIAGGYVPLDDLKKIASEYLNIVDNLTSGGTTSLLSAEQGKVLKSQIDGIKVILASDDVNFDTVQELVDSIKTLQTSFSTILVNDLTTGGTTKALTAEQGKVLKDLYDDGKIKAENLATTLGTAIADETKRAGDAEIVLNTSITNEIKRATESEKISNGVINDLITKTNDLSSSITLEIDRATKVENASIKSINSEIKRATDIDSQLETILANEIDRATSAETGLNTSIVTETNRAISAETASNTTLNNEINRAVSAETALQNTKEDKANKGIAGGYVPLDDLKKIASEYLNIVDNLTSGGTTSLLSAEQGKVLQTKINGINTILSSDDVNLDTVQELVGAIKTLQTSLNTILVNDLTTGGTTKALTAEQGKVLKELFDSKIAVENDKLLHISGNEIKTGTLTTTKFITSGGTADQYVKGDGSLATLILPTPIDITGKEDKANKGIAGGYVGLDELKKVASEYLNIVDNLTSGGTTSLLSAEQGKILKSQIDGINTILSSDDNNFDTLQKVVTEIKTNKIDNTTLLHKTGDEIKTGKLIVDNIITKGGTADQYVKGDGSLATLILPTPIDITGKEDISKKGIAGGYVPLAESKKIASEYLNIIDNLTSGGTTSLLSAEQGKILKSQIDGIKVILASDDVNLDTVQELVGAIKELQTSLSTILVNDLTTGGTTKALTAEQGKVLKGLTDTINNKLVSDDTNLDTLQKVVTEIKTNKIDNTTLLHKTGDEIKTGTLTTTKFITSGGTADQYVKGDGSLSIFAPTVPTLQEVTEKGNTTDRDLILNGLKLGYDKINDNLYLGNLNNNTTGSRNTALGLNSLFSNTTGGDNTGIGLSSLYSNTIGFENTAVGTFSLGSNTTGSYNTALGKQSLSSNITGICNTSIGNSSLQLNNRGEFNASLGFKSLQLNTLGSYNAGFGNQSLQSNTTGNNNTALGCFSLILNTIGSYNVGIGTSGNPLNPTNKDGNLAIHSSREANQEPLVQGNFIDRWFKIAGKIIIHKDYAPNSKDNVAFTKILTAQEDGTVGWENKPIPVPPIDISGKEDISKKGIAGGYVPLDDFKKVAGEYLNIVDNLTSGGTTSLLSAEQGKVLKSQIDGIKIILASDDINLDTVQELVGAIKTLQTSLNTILVNDLTTGGTTKALTAEQGKVLKGLTDNINTKLVSDDTNLDTLQKVVTEVKANKIDNSTLLHKTENETKTGKLLVFDSSATIIDKNLGDGILVGKTDNGIGIYGDSLNLAGVWGQSTSGSGLVGNNLGNGKIASFKKNFIEVGSVENDGTVIAPKFKTSGGTDKQYVKGDGSLGNTGELQKVYNVRLVQEQTDTDYQKIANFSFERGGGTVHINLTGSGYGLVFQMIADIIMGAGNMILVRSLSSNYTQGTFRISGQVWTGRYSLEFKHPLPWADVSGGIIDIDITANSIAVIDLKPTNLINNISVIHEHTTQAFAQLITHT